MKSLFAKLKSKANLQRNAFDLSYSNKFTASPGMLLPCYVQEVNPNEHFVISPQSFLRTMPLNTASFVRAKQNIEFYFVPYRLLCRQFPQFVVGTEYNISSLSELNKYNNGLPTFDLSSVISILTDLCKTDNNDLDICGMPIWRGSVRLLDLLGYGVNLPSLRSFAENPSHTFNKTLDVNPLRLLAYQKIYYDFYRNPMYELNNPDAYNIDSLFDSGSLSDPDFTSYNSGPSNNQFFALRYRNWKKDYFNCVSPYFQGADWLTTSIAAPYFDGYKSSTVNIMKPFSSLAGNNAQSYLSGTSDVPKNLFSISNLRSAFALDKLYRLSIAAGDGDYGSQIRAHYGFDVPYDNCKSRFLGGISEPISISEVITTATTSEAPTGDICGKGLSANAGQRIVFDSKEHGVIMGIFSVVPEADYNASGVDRFNIKTSREDYYQPEFADLGLSPLSLYEYSYCTPFEYSNENRSIGYIPRYAEYKTRVDYVHGEFESFTEKPNGSQGRLSAWVAPRQTQLASNFSATNEFLKIKPNIWNNLSSLTFTGKEEEDIFIVDFRANVQAVRPMSVSGLPSL
nr:MAG TPA_asm: Major capsid protein [Microviridae sp.]